MGSIFGNFTMSILQVVALALVLSFTAYAASCSCSNSGSNNINVPCLTYHFETGQHYQVGYSPYTGTIATCRMALCYRDIVQQYYGIRGPFTGGCDVAHMCAPPRVCTTSCRIDSQVWKCIDNKWTMTSWKRVGSEIVNLGCSCPSTSPTPVDVCAPSGGLNVVPTPSLTNFSTQMSCTLSPTPAPTAIPSKSPSWSPSGLPSQSPSGSPSQFSAMDTFSPSPSPPPVANAAVGDIVGIASGSALGFVLILACGGFCLLFVLRLRRKRQNEEAAREEKRLEGILEAMPVPEETPYVFKEVPVDDKEIEILAAALLDVGVPLKAAQIYAINFQQGGCTMEDIFRLSAKELGQYNVKLEDIKKIRKGISKKQQDKIDMIRKQLREMGMEINEAINQAETLLMQKNIETFDALVAGATLKRLKSYGFEEQVINKILQRKMGAMRPPEGKKYDVFISYAQQDTKKEAAYLTEQIEQDPDFPGVQVFRDKDTAQFSVYDLVPSAQTAKVVICMLSANYCRRPFCMIELFYSLRSEQASIVPVITEGFLHSEIIPIIEDKTRLKKLLDKKAWQLLAEFGIGISDLQDTLRRVMAQNAMKLEMGGNGVTTQSQISVIKAAIKKGMLLQERDGQV